MKKLVQKLPQATISNLPSNLPISNRSISFTQEDISQSSDINFNLILVQFIEF